MRKPLANMSKTKSMCCKSMGKCLFIVDIVFSWILLNIQPVFLTHLLTFCSGHSYIPRCVDVIEESGRQCLILEYVEHEKPEVNGLSYVNIS
jgi:hypothetical protein